MSEELKPCPFCGRAAEHNDLFAWCSPNGEHMLIQTIIAAWNRRDGGWRPIETAPKDGTLVDLWYPEGGRFTDMTWRDGQWWIGDTDDPECYGGVVNPKSQPSHWMRPIPPTGKDQTQP